jgi:2-polyprenyl-6-hydroxyphenyl methylase/3-demethylubiquinone-9 3-methyltransferase
LSRKALVTRSVRRREDIREFFDGVAGTYRESHGQADRLLQYRVGILQALMPDGVGGLLVEIGCGPGDHLLALAERFERAIGLDLAPAMVERARQLRERHPSRSRIEFAVDPAEELGSLSEGSVAVLFCVGAFEHMPEKERVLRRIRRVLAPEGRFVCMTPNGGYVWYSHLARWLGCEFRHLSTDHFLSEAELRTLLTKAGFAIETTGNWSFVPRGDMPKLAAFLLDGLDTLGRVFRIPALRGGIYFKARPLAGHSSPASAEH